MAACRAILCAMNRCAREGAGRFPLRWRVSRGNRKEVKEPVMRARSVAVMTARRLGPLGLALLLGAFVPNEAWASGPLAFITNVADNTVSVIEPATHTVTATVPVGARPLGVAVTRDGGHAYVANVVDNTVSVIDAATK